MKSDELSLKVRYAETDKMGRVYHANYLIYLDLARTEFLRRSHYLFDVVRIVLRIGTRHRGSDAAIVDPYLTTDFPAEEFIYRDTRRFPGDIP